MACIQNSKQYLEEILSFIFTTSYCQFGSGYSISALSDSQRRLLQLLIDWGVVYCPSQSKYFYPCRIALSLLHKPSEEEIVTNHKNISIIVETNFQVLAYLETDLHFAMICLFVDATTMIRFGNMVIGSITRQSAKESFKIGISSAQIIDFLEVHAHPRVRGKSKIVPENVSDQLILWEREKFRINVSDAMFIDVSELAWGEKRDFLFESLCNQASLLGVCLWSDPVKKRLAVTPDGYLQLQSFAQYI